MTQDRLSLVACIAASLCFVGVLAAGRASAAERPACVVRCKIIDIPQTQQYRALVAQALRLVIAAAPEDGRHLFGDVANVFMAERKSLQIKLTTSADPDLDALRAAPGGASRDLDAATFAAIEVQSGAMMIDVLVVADRMFTDAGVPRSDALARAVVALSHEVFGAAQAHLELDGRGIGPMRIEDRCALELRAFNAGITAVERLLAGAEPTLSAALRADLERLLPLEHTRLQLWQQRCSKTGEP